MPKLRKKGTDECFGYTKALAQRADMEVVPDQPAPVAEEKPKPKPRARRKKAETDADS